MGVVEAWWGWWKLGGGSGSLVGVVEAWWG